MALLVLHLLAGVGMAPTGGKQLTGLVNGPSARAWPHPRQQQRVVVQGAGVVGLQRHLGEQLDQGGGGAHPQGLHVAVGGPGHHPRRAGRRAQIERRVHRQPHPAARKGHTGIEPHRAAFQRDAQAPGDLAQADAAAQVEHRFAQPVLQVLQMVGGDPQAVDELTACIV